jgi:hypothetical protein
LGIDDQTVLDALHAFNADGLNVLVKGSSRPKRTRLVFGPEQAERLRARLHRSPRAFGEPPSVWRLALAAEVSVAKGVTANFPLHPLARYFAPLSNPDYNRLGSASHDHA